MNKKKNPDLVRNIHYLIRLNKPENESFHNLLKQAGGKKPMPFIREMLTKGVVLVPLKREEKISVERLLTTMMEYRTNFKRLSSLIKAHDPSLNYQIEELVRSMQKVIDRL